jgi:Holliday junction DNA helicase RuvA
VLPPEDLARAVASQDKAALARANGVGSRLAGRIVAELQSRVGELPSATPPEAGLAAGGAITGGAVADALSALVHLGYGRSEAHAALSRAAASLGGEASVDTLIRTSLRELAPG